MRTENATDTEVVETAPGCLTLDGLDDRQVVSGREPVLTSDFEAQAPWLVSWRTRYDNLSPALGHFEADLYDAATDQFLGVIVRWYGTGSGSMLIEQSGRFRFRVQGTSDSWTLQVQPLDSQQAERLKSAAEVARFAPLPRHGVTRQQIGAIRAFRVAPGPALVIEAIDGRAFRAVFPDGCPGIEQARELSLITGVGRDWEHYTGVLLDSGRACEFGQVTAEPRVVPQS